MKEAMKEAPSPWSGLDHEWVGQWLLSLGLPQFQRTFCDARFDGNMLNMISLEDLELLDITVPFHIASIKRALQALRYAVSTTHQCFCSLSYVYTECVIMTGTT